ncbi:MAG: threonine--tRNA ligase, partial [Patescibacteria group bacterium]
MAKNNNIEKIRHSLAHLMAMTVLENHPNIKFGIGPIIENGFYYDFDFTGEEHSPSEDKLIKPEEEMCKLIKQDVKFEREEITAKKAKEVFANQPYKLELIDELEKNNEKISIYKSGDFVDL